jgi:hypothetical protein
MADLSVPSDQQQPDRRHDRRALAAAWFGILGPAFAWAAQLVLSDAFAEVGCEAGGFSSISPVLVGITVVALGIAAAAGIVAFVQLRKTRGHDDGDVRGQRARFMALCGCMSSGLFIVLIVLGGIVPHLLLSTCTSP